MATENILQLTAAIGITGSEWLEAVQVAAVPGGWASIRLTSAQIAALAASLAPTGPTVVVAAVPAAGANNDYTASGQFSPAVGFVDLAPTADCNITGLAAGGNGQIVIITNLSAHQMILNALNTGSATANRFRMAADQILTQNNSRAFKYSTTLAKWVML